MSSTNLSHRQGYGAVLKGFDLKLFHKQVGDERADWGTHGCILDLFIILTLEEEVCIFKVFLLHPCRTSLPTNYSGGHIFLVSIPHGGAIPKIPIIPFTSVHSLYPHNPSPPVLVEPSLVSTYLIMWFNFFS